MVHHKKNKTILIFLAFSTLFLLSAQVVRGACSPLDCANLSDCHKPICYTNPDCGCPPTPAPPGEKSLGFFSGLGALSTFINNLQANPGNVEPAASTFTKFISTAIGIMTVIAFIWFIFVLFTGAIAWLGSGGDKAKLQEAQKKITTGLVGLIIVISAIFLVKIIGVVFGIDILDLTNLIKTL